MKKKRLFISLSPAAFNALQELANSKGVTKSIIIEQYLRRIKKRRKDEIHGGVELAGCDFTKEFTQAGSEEIKQKEDRQNGDGTEGR